MFVAIFLLASAQFSAVASGSFRTLGDLRPPPVSPSSEPSSQLSFHPGISQFPSAAPTVSHAPTSSTAPSPAPSLNHWEEVCDPLPWQLTWAELSDDPTLLGHAVDLGYNQTLWDADEDPENLVDKFWSDLSIEENNHLIALGYNEGRWEEFYEDYSFAELPLNVQDAAETLGYNQTVWDCCRNSTIDGLEDSFFAELTQEQQDAAMVFGYDECLWNLEEPSDGTSCC